MKRGEDEEEEGRERGETDKKTKSSKNGTAMMMRESKAKSCPDCSGFCENILSSSPTALSEDTTAPMSGTFEIL